MSKRMYIHGFPTVNNMYFDEEINRIMHIGFEVLTAVL
jgi:hypothetical protein